ncbi:ABC transporter ATP-binding protein [Streptococcus iners]|uniref:ABC transporter ATP-binding protein n=1 Tax=Streptococcus iners subsp. hyiners TaxID=3028083 RepID=A0AA96VHI3_9STRE|nr:ABC transporter ATP-binding protein [Streptococcus sp. 29892]MCK4029705.1 ABC transporter ATP-binding protein [Streptococcus suis]WNY48466.1 ABC transporter ATP-binding protein [Streptococcus sp. 29892]
MLDISNLTISSPSRDILDNVSLKVTSGESIAIVGESGSGKTTLIKSILALPLTSLRQTAGHIQFEGQTIQLTNKRQELPFIGIDIAWITQNAKASFNEKRTIWAHYQDLYKTYSKYSSDLRTLEECFSLVDLPYSKEIIRKYPFEFSGGQMQRIGIALALVAKPKLLLADEPTSALDALNKKILVHLLKKLHKNEGITLVIVTHDMSVAKDISERLVVMKDGKIVETGTTFEVLSHPKEAYTRKLLAAIPRLRTV